MTKFRAFLPFIIFTAVIVLAGLPLWQGKDPAIHESPLVGKAAPGFSVPQLSGGTLAAGDVKGPAVLNFFASWCVTCPAEQKVLAQLAKDSGIPVYGIAYKDKKADLARWLERHGNPFRAVGLDEDGRAGIDWGVTGVPETFLIARDGSIAKKYTGPLTETFYHQEVKADVERLK